MTNFTNVLIALICMVLQIWNLNHQYLCQRACIVVYLEQITTITKLLFQNFEDGMNSQKSQQINCGQTYECFSAILFYPKLYPITSVNNVPFNYFTILFRLSSCSFFSLNMNQITFHLSQHRSSVWWKENHVSLDGQNYLNDVNSHQFLKSNM